jgi:uncharacterized protein
MKLTIKLLAAFVATSVAISAADTAPQSSNAAQSIDRTASAAATDATSADAQAVVERLHVEKSLERFVGQMSQLIGQLNDEIITKTNGKVLATDLKQHQARVLEIITKSVDAAQLKQEIAAVYAQSFTKSELAALASPENLSAALIERQAAAQQLANNLMMTHLADAMSAVKTLNDTFARQQKGKVANALRQQRDRNLPLTTGTEYFMHR